jgi:hypothetical protein
MECKRFLRKFYGRRVNCYTFLISNYLYLIKISISKQMAEV